MRPSPWVQLELLHDGQICASLRSPAASLRVGRLSTCELRCDHPALARVHVLVERVGEDRLLVQDLCGRTGLGGRRLRREFVASGSELDLDGLRLRIALIEAPAAVPLAPPAPPAQAEPVEPPLLAELEDASAPCVLRVALWWRGTLLGLRHHRPGEALWVGATERCHLVVDTSSLDLEELPLVEPVGERLALVIVPGLRGLLRSGAAAPRDLDAVLAAGAALPAALLPGARRVLLQRGDRGRVELGEARLDFEVEAAPRRPRYPWQGLVGRSTLFGMAGAATLWSAILLLAFLAVPDVDGLRLDGLEAAGRFVGLIVSPERRDSEALPAWFRELARRQAPAPLEGPARTPPPTGRVERPREPRRAALAGPADTATPRAQRADLRRKVRARGALAALGEQESALAALWGRSDRALGADPVHALADDSGPRIGASFGSSALAATLPGQRGGDSLGPGSLSPAGPRGPRQLGPPGPPRLDERPQGDVKVHRRKPQIESDEIDRETVMRVVQRHRAEVRYCYERELAQRKDLAGKVTLHFTIGPDGRVVRSGIGDSTLEHAGVHRCLEERALRWRFPHPTRGGLVEVRYPFIFRSH